MATLTKVQDFGTDNQSYISFGTDATLESTDIRTIIALVYFKGAGGGNNGYVIGRTPSASVNGLRFFLNHNSGSPRITFGLDSGSAGNPQRSGNNGGVAYSGWYYIAATTDGTLNQTGVKLYQAPEASSLVGVPSYATGGNGTGSLDANSGDTFYVGNRAGLDRGVNAKIAWIACYSDTKALADLQAIQTDGPLDHTTNMLFCWANGQDYSSGARTPAATGTSVTDDAVNLPANLDLGGATGITITAAPAEASGEALPVSLSITGTVSVNPAPAEASGEAMPVSLTVSGAIAITAATAEATGEALPVSLSVSSIQIYDDHDRSSVNLSGSSVSGTGDSAVISIKPKVQESEVVSSETRWLKPHARVTGLNGIKPKFRFLDYKSGVGGSHNYPWPATRRPMYSYTGAEDDWFYFDNCTLSAGSHTEFWNNTNFTGDAIYVSWNRAVRPKRFGQWLDDWQTAHPTRVFPTQPAIDYTPTANVSTWPAQWAIADEFSTQTDSLGATIPVAPLYSFAIRDDSVSSPLGSKAVAHFQLMTHAGEDMGLYIIREMIEYLLAGAGDAPALLQYFDFTFSFNNVPGWTGGGWRGSWTQGVGGDDDSNRHANESGTGLEIVDKPKAVMQAIFSGRTVAFFLDAHGSFNAPLWIYNTTGLDDTNFVDAVNSFGLPTVLNGGTTEGAGFWSTWANSYTPDSFTYEVGDPSPVPDADLTAAGVNLARGINKLRVDGNLDMPSGVIALTPAAAEASGDALPVSLTVTANVDAGVAEATGEAMPVSLLVDIAPRPAAAEAVGDALPVSLSIVEYVDFVIASASASGEAIPVSLRITGASWAPVSDQSETWADVIDNVETWTEAV